MESEPPRIAPSLLRLAGQCRLRFRHHVDGRTRPLTFSDDNRQRRFLLSNAVSQVLYQAHAADSRGLAPLAELLHASPPEGLLAEERWIFGRALDNYLDVAADRPGGLIQFRDPEFPQFPVRPHRDGHFALRVRLDLAFKRDDDVLEVRQIAFGPPRGPLEQDSTVRAVALALAGYERVAYVHLNLLHGDVRELEIDHAFRVQAAAELVPPLLEALSDPDPRPTPGVWCQHCPFLRHCPTVAQESGDALVLLATGEVD